MHLRTLTPERQVSESGYRSYSPSLGRFVSRDPIGEEGGIHAYAFVENAPTHNVDKLGRQKWRKCKPPKIWGPKPDGEVPPADGCSLGPLKYLTPSGDADDPTGQCSFKWACNIHDLCYSVCKRTKKNCDDQFFQNLGTACSFCASAMNPGPGKDAFTDLCNDLVNKYYSGVSGTLGGAIGGVVKALANSAYKDRQKKNCGCVCRPPPMPPRGTGVIIIIL